MFLRSVVGQRENCSCRYRRLRRLRRTRYLTNSPQLPNRKKIKYFSMDNFGIVCGVMPQPTVESVFSPRSDQPMPLSRQGERWTQDGGWREDRIISFGFRIRLNIG